MFPTLVKTVAPRAERPGELLLDMDISPLLTSVSPVYANDEKVTVEHTAVSGIRESSVPLAQMLDEVGQRAKCTVRLCETCEHVDFDLRFWYLEHALCSDTLSRWLGIPPNQLDVLHYVQCTAISRIPTQIVVDVMRVAAPQGHSYTI